MMAGVPEGSYVTFATRKATIASDGGSIGLNVEDFPEGEFGVRIKAIVEGSAAAAAGDLRVNDVIVKVDDIDVLNSEHDDVVDKIVEGCGVGKFTLTVALWADINDDYIDIADLDIRVVTIDRSNPEVKLGAQVVNVLSNDEDVPGAQVVNVGVGSLAERSGLRKGDRIFKIDGEDVYQASYDHIIDLLTMEKKFEVEVVEQPIDEEIADQTREVTLDKSHGLGMKIISNHELEGVRISFVVPGSAADLSGQVKVGDHIVQVNGQDIRSANHDAAVQIIQDADEIITLVLEMDDDALPEEDAETTEDKYSAVASPVIDYRIQKRMSSSAGAKIPKRNSIIRRRPNEGLGLKIKSDDGSHGVIIDEVIEGSAAAAAGNIKVGDIILNIDGVAADKMSHDEVIVALTNGGDNIALTVAHPDELDKMLRMVTISKRGGAKLGLQVMKEDTSEFHRIGVTRPV